MIVKDFYQDCLLHERSSLAHCIHHLLAEKKISLDDDIANVDFDQVNHQKVEEMIQNNVLGIYKICVYSLKMNQQKDFVFIFSGSRDEAIQFYTETFHQLPLNCHESLLDFQFSRGKAVISFRDMRKEYVSFPAIAGYFTRMYC
jgi:hypothetical protein